jgi:hypothetical protein
MRSDSQAHPGNAKKWNAAPISSARGREHCADQRIRGRKELAVEDERGRGPVQEEVVPLDRRADQAREHDLAQGAGRADAVAGLRCSSDIHGSSRRGG